MKMISQLLSNLCQKKKYILVAYFIKVVSWGTNIQQKKEKELIMTFNEQKNFTAKLLNFINHLLVNSQYYLNMIQSLFLNYSAWTRHCVLGSEDMVNKS